VDRPVRAERVKKCRSAGAICGYCGGLIGLGQQEGFLDGTWQCVSCIRKQQLLAEQQQPDPDAQVSWADVYRVPERTAEQRKRDMVQFLRTHGTPTPGRAPAR
jgi:hypothetical protein